MHVSVLLVAKQMLELLKYLISQF